MLKNVWKWRSCFLVYMQLLAIVLIVLSSNLSIAQVNLWGMTNAGGLYDQGVLFQHDVNSSDQIVHHNFNPEYTGSLPEGGLLATNGKIYGITYQGGASNLGVIYSFDTVTSIYENVHFFNGSQGSRPVGKLVEYNNNLYGMTSTGGNNEYGVIFRWDLVGESYSVIHNFNDVQGKYPTGELKQFNGHLYGMTNRGGNNDYGVMFDYNLANGGSYNVLHYFNGAQGRAPRGGLEFNGLFLYGMTQFGGDNNRGVIFYYYNSVYAVLHHFDDDGGRNPEGSLISINNDLYGMTRRGGAHDDGVIFKYNTTSMAYDTLHHFDNSDSDNGGNPTGTLTYSNGMLYGSANGGNGNWGVIFKYDISSGQYQVIHDFDYLIGTYPTSQSFLINNEALFGVTRTGGEFDKGVLFHLDTATTEYEPLYHFKLQDNTGKKPKGDLLEYNGKYYGLTTLGGLHNYGTLFSYDEEFNQYTVLHHFDWTTGANPNGKLIEFNGKLYGMTYGGGNNNFGLVFVYNTTTDIYTPIHLFNNILGSHPYGSLLLDDGRFYGLTGSGSTFGHGNIFSIDTLGGQFFEHHFFDAISGTQPRGSLIKVGQKLFGTTDGGGSSSKGVIFSHDLSNDNYQAIKHFTGADGAMPKEDLIFSEGKLYGMTNLGGTDNQGVIFECDTIGGGYSVLHHFDGSTGGHPNGNLLEVNGVFYGMTYDGGNANLGVAFQYDPSAVPAYQVLMEFDGGGGSYPFGAFIRESPCKSVDLTPPTLIVQDISVTIQPQGYYVLNVNTIDDGSYDNCEIDTIFANYDTLTCAFGRNVEVEVTAIDLSGNIAKDTVVVRLQGPVSSQVVYVDQNAQGLETGLSWEDAFNYLDSWNCPCMIVPDIDTVKVAQGVYKPFQQNQNKSYSIPRNIVMMGGYSNAGLARDTTGLLTILDGNILDTTLAEDNMRQVLIIRNASTGVIVDGFTIRNGYGNGIIDEERRGAGVRCDGIGTLRNVIIENNYSELDGSAIYVNEPDGNPVSLTLKNVTVRANNPSDVNLIFSQALGTELIIDENTVNIE